MPSSSADTGSILLIGFMGAGKSSVGRALATRLGCSFVDLDNIVEAKAGRTIAEIFASDGEAEFRKLESEALREVLSSGGERRVIALGGGAYMRSSNRELIARSPALVVYLEVSFKEAARRIGSFNGERPLATDWDRLQSLYNERRAIYEQANFRTDTTDKPVERVVEEVAAWVGTQGWQ